jgi:Tfp pilus assembly protein FimT
MVHVGRPSFCSECTLSITVLQTSKVKQMKRESGFTLIEAMIVMAIMMTAVFVVPAFYSYFNRQGAGLAAEQLRGDLQLARIMAINRKQNCAIVLNRPKSNQYINSLNRQTVDLSLYRGGVNFAAGGPDGGKAGSRIAFNPQGMSTSAVPVNIYLSNRKESVVYRIRVLAPGGISVARWNGAQWH